MKDKLLQAIDLIWIAFEFIIVLCIAIPILTIYHLLKLVYDKIKKTRFNLYHRAKIDKRP
jgi:heme/copper-type cytochrome/quinol oxidase subunit 2